MIFTHKRRTYLASCVQLRPDNFQEVIDVLKQHGCNAVPERGQLMLRWEESANRKYSIEMMQVGDVVRIGENGTAKIMSEADYNASYELI